MLIEIQNHNPLFASIIIEKTKQILTEQIRLHLQTIETVQINHDLLANHYVQSMYHLDDWNQKQEKPLENAELDMIFIRLVIDPLIGT